MRGWSQAYLAHQINVPSHYISRWERGEVSPSPYYQQQLCELFGATAEDLGFLSPVSASLEKSLDPHSMHLPQADPLGRDAWRRPSTLLVMAVSRSWVRRCLVPLVVLLLLGLGMSASSRVLPRSSAPSIGFFAFTSSGEGQANTSEGMADGVVLHVHLGREPATGMDDDAWLLPDQNNPEGVIISLGTLSPQGNLVYRDPLHTNLLLKHSALLITEQPRSPIPQAPSLDRTDWRAHIVIDQQDAPGTPYSLLDHLRHLFAIDPEVEAAGLHGGLVAWLAHNTAQLALLANDAQKQSHNARAFHQDLVRMLEYLDGTRTVAQDLPGLALPVNPQATIGLLTLFPEQPDPGYLQHIQNHLRGMITSPGVSNHQRELANQVSRVLDGITAQLQAIRKEILQLLKYQITLQLTMRTEHILHASQNVQRVTLEMMQLLAFEIPSEDDNVA